MKISKTHLRRIIREAIGLEPHDNRDSDEWEDSEYKRGYQDALDGLPIADDATAAYDDGYETADSEIEADMKAAEEILSTRMGNYSSSPYGKKINEGVDPRGLKTMLKKLGVTRAYGGVTDALSEAFYEYEGDAEDMKEAVEGYHGGYRDDSGQAIDWPLDVYQQIHDLYSKKKASYRAQRRY